MNTIKNPEILSKQGSSPSFEGSKGDLAKNFSAPRGSIPNWEQLDIKDVADVYVGSNKKIVLKDVREDKRGRKYVEINGRKYYEYKEGEGKPGESFYISRGGALFFGDKLGVSSIWDGISFRCLTESMDNSFLVEQRKSKYYLSPKMGPTGGAVYLQQLIKSERFGQNPDDSNNLDYVE